MVPSLCNLYLQQYSLFYIQTLHDDCSHIEDVHLPFCAHLINIFLILTGVELRHFFLPRCLGAAVVCVICNSNSVHYIIFKVCVMIVHTLMMYISHFVHI